MSLEGETKKVKTGEERDEGAAAAPILKTSQDPQQMMAELMSLSDLKSMTDTCKFMRDPMHSGFQIVLQRRLAELREVANSVVSGTPRERFDALCAHMKRGENRHESFKGVPLRNPETTYRCEACLHVYDPATDSDPEHPVVDFNALPATWVCPSCKEPKSTYIKGQIRHIKLYCDPAKKKLGMRAEPCGDYLKITSVKPNHVGLKKNDVLLAVDGKTLFRATEEKLNEMVPLGATVVFDVASYAGNQYMWQSSFTGASLWAEPLVKGLINRDHGGIDLKDVCKLLDSSVPSCNAGTLSKGDMFGTHQQDYEYDIEFPQEMRVPPRYAENTRNISITVRIHKHKPLGNKQFVPNECAVHFSYSPSVEYKCFVDDAVTKFVEQLESMVRTNPEDDVPTVTFWNALITFSENCTLMPPKNELEGRIRIGFLQFLLVLLVYRQTYPFFFSTAQGRVAKFERVSFRASFVDKCLAL